MPPGLAFRFSFWHTGGICQSSGGIEAESVTAEDIVFIGEFIAEQSCAEPPEAVGDSCVKHGNGSRPTERCATWSAAVCC